MNVFGKKKLMQVILRDHVTLLPHHFNGFLHKDALASIEVLLPNITIILKNYYTFGLNMLISFLQVHNLF